MSTKLIQEELKALQIRLEATGLGYILILEDPENVRTVQTISNTKFKLNAVANAKTAHNSWCISKGLKTAF